MPEPEVYPVFLSSDEVIGLIAYHRTTALSGRPPGAPPMFNRWKSHVIGGSSDEREYPLVQAMRMVLARVHWWRTNRRNGHVPRPCPIGPIHPVARGHVRWAIRAHNTTAIQTIALLRTDVRRWLAACEAHDTNIEQATAILCAETAAGHIVAFGRAGVWRSKRYTSGTHERIPPEFFASPHNTILPDGWATCGFDQSVQHWADWKGPDWGDVRFRRDEAFRLFGRPVPGEEVTTPSETNSERTKSQQITTIRKRRIERFQENQRICREWVCLADVADWCARASGDIKPDEERRVIAFTELGRSLNAGEFEQNGRSRVLFLNPSTCLAKMTREQMSRITAANPSDIVRSCYLAHCWIPTALCRSWFDARRVLLPPWLKTPPLLSTANQRQNGDQPTNQKLDVASPLRVRANDPGVLPLWLTPMQALAWVCTFDVGVVWRADLERGHHALADQPDEFPDEWFPPRHRSDHAHFGCMAWRLSRRSRLGDFL